MIEHDGVDSEDSALACHRRRHRLTSADLCLLDQVAGVDIAQNALMAERSVERKLTLGVKDGHLRAGSCTAGASIYRAGPRGVKSRRHSKPEIQVEAIMTLQTRLRRRHHSLPYCITNID